MSKETLKMSRKERRRLRVLEQVRAGYLTLMDASKRLDVGYRQTKRIWKRYREEGESGLVHRSRGMPSNRALLAEFKEEVLEAYKTHCAGYGPTLASEVLEEEHGLAVNLETLRRWLIGARLIAPGRAPRQHRKRRERRARFGQMLQIDGSDHHWLGPERERTVLMVAVDDATGRAMALMSETETTRSAYALLWAWIRRYGVPEQVYVDGRSAYTEPVRDARPDELRRGTGPLSDFGRACERLGIEIIVARSPEAKGRVERKNGVLQDRFVKFLARRKIDSISGANAAVGAFMDDLNTKQAKEPSQVVDAHRQRPSDATLNDIFSWHVLRTVRRDWTVADHGRYYQIERQTPMPVPGEKVDVRTRFDGTKALIWHERELECTEDGEPMTTKKLSRPLQGAGPRQTAPPQPGSPPPT